MCKCRERTQLMKKAVKRNVSIQKTAGYIGKSVVRDTHDKVKAMLARRQGKNS